VKEDHYEWGDFKLALGFAHRYSRGGLRVGFLFFVSKEEAVEARARD
jgi:hypothetical protein